MAVALLVMAASFDAAATQELECSGAQKQWVVADLFFARNHVSEAGFARFLATEVTPRFPGGFTVIDAKGQWRAPGSDRISRERSKVLTIAMPPDAANDKRLAEIIEAYKLRFKQQSVGLIVRPACVSF